MRFGVDEVSALRGQMQVWADEFCASEDGVYVGLVCLVMVEKRTYWPFELRILHSMLPSASVGSSAPGGGEGTLGASVPCPSRESRPGRKRNGAGGKHIGGC
jgi:hypothetical protein